MSAVGEARKHTERTQHIHVSDPLHAILRSRENPKIGSRVDPDISGVPGMQSFWVLTWTEYITDHFLPALASLGIPLGEATILAPS